MPIDPRQRIAIYLDRMIATRPEGVTLPTFSALFDPASAEPYRNYATPVGGSCPAEADLRALIEEFERRGRVPRLEFVPDASPGLAQALLDAGFVEEGLLPLMILVPRRTDPEEGLPIAFSLAYSPPELAEAARVQNEAFGGEPTSQADIDRLLRLVGRGGLVAIGREPPGSAVASGLVTAPVESVAELAAVGVAAGYRRRGYGRALAAFLGKEATARGVDLLFVMAAGEAEARLHRAAGFSDVGSILHVRRPTHQPTG